VLWFSLCQPGRGEAQSLEAVYQYLVPQPSQDGLRQLGVIGGISIAVCDSFHIPSNLIAKQLQLHPTTDHPAFFVHPCNTPDALRSLTSGDHLTPEQYLSIWLGLIGPSVGLHIPSKLLSE